MPACCGAEHPWDRYHVQQKWWPKVLRYLIVGENPGNLGSEYFYAVPADYSADRVVVRKQMLRGLYSQGLIPEPTLPGFREGGFLFDHAIRCPLPPEVVNIERQNATRYASHRVEHPLHLQRSLSDANAVWVMGHLASNAVANATNDFPRERRRISKPPFPGAARPNSRFFVSEYFTWRNAPRCAKICEAFSRFVERRAQQIVGRERRERVSH